jgi:DNA-binding transcriptional regulator GbsR (MarR family)
VKQEEIDELAIQYNKTKDPGIRDQWYKAVKKFSEILKFNKKKTKHPYQAFWEE